MKFVHPSYWLSWLLFAVLRAISFLPYKTQIVIGQYIGSVTRVFFAKRRRIAEINLRLCFPDWTEEKRQQVLKKHFESLGIHIIEYGISWWWSDKRFRPLARIEGLENLQQALKKNKGVILLAGHFTILEAICRVLKLYADFHVIYRKNNNELIEYIIKNEREKHEVKVIQHDDIRTMIKSLRSNNPILYLPDRNFGRKYSIFVPFFGIQAATVPSTSRLAAIDKTPVLPVIQQRLPDYQGYRLIIQKELENFPTDDVVRDTIRINQIYEKQIRQNPEDYLWVHRRFKTRPPGEEPIYN